MNIQLNGEPRATAARTVADLIHTLDLPQALLLVELNESPLPREAWPTTNLQENDRVELIRIAAGG
jgi:thiamine biosynthesis protein ThiS